MDENQKHLVFNVTCAINMAVMKHSLLQTRLAIRDMGSRLPACAIRSRQGNTLSPLTGTASVRPNVAQPSFIGGYDVT